MVIKLLKSFFFILSAILNCSFAQVKLPNTVMYELIDCANDKMALKEYLDLHSISDMADKTSYFQFRPKKNLEDYIRVTDSINRSELARIIDTLRLYKIERTDLVHEHFYWLYQKYGAIEHRKSGSNYFTFQKAGKKIFVSFGDLGINEGQFVLVEPAKLDVSKSDKDLPVIAVSDVVAYDPLARGRYFEQLLQQGKLEELFKSCYSDKTMDPKYKKEHPKMITEVKERMEQEKNEVRQCFGRLKPGSYQIKLIYMRWERETHRLNESDRGLFQYILKEENKESILNFKYYTVKDQLYLGEFEEKEMLPN